MNYHNLSNIDSGMSDTNIQVHTKKTGNNINQHPNGKTSIEIQRYNPSNIFEENSYLLQMKRVFEHKNDHISAIHCTNIIYKLPILSDFEVYRLHVTWFCDEFIVYATERPCGITIAHSEHLQRQIKEQLQLHQIHLVGLVGNPL